MQANEPRQESRKSQRLKSIMEEPVWLECGRMSSHAAGRVRFRVSDSRSLPKAEASFTLQTLRACPPPRRWAEPSRLLCSNIYFPISVHPCPSVVKSARLKGLVVNLL